MSQYDNPLAAKTELRNDEARKQLLDFGKSLRETREKIAEVNGALKERDIGAPDADKRKQQLAKQLLDLRGAEDTLFQELVHWAAIDEVQEWIRERVEK